MKSSIANPKPDWDFLLPEFKLTALQLGRIQGRWRQTELSMDVFLTLIREALSSPEPEYAIQEVDT